MTSIQKIKWYQKPLTVILFLIIFFPVGLILMWKHKLWNQTARILVSVFFGVMVISNMSKSSGNSPIYGEYSSHGNESNYYCRSGSYIELKENNVVEFYTLPYNGKRHNRACFEVGTYSLDKNNNLTITGLNNPNAMGEDSQFNGKYVWKKGRAYDAFGVYSFHKIGSNISLTNYSREGKAIKIDNVNEQTYNEPIISATKALNLIKEQWDYQLGDFANEKNIAKDSLKEYCNANRCVKFLLLNDYLIASYRVNGVSESGTQIIDLNSGINLLDKIKDDFYIEDVNQKSLIINAGAEGYDNIGRYFQKVTYNLKTEEYLKGEKYY